MKIVISMKSNFAFNRLNLALKSRKETSVIEIYQDNVQYEKVLDDVLEFWMPKLIVLDNKLVEFEQFEQLVLRHNIPVIYFSSDFDEIIENVIDIFDLSVEDEIADEVTNYSDVDSISDNGQDESRKIHYVQTEKQKEIVIQDRIVEKEVIKTAYTTVPNRIIVVGSLWQGAGSTTVSINLAKAFSKRGLKVAYIEYPNANPYMFDYLSIPSKENPSREEIYYDHAKLIRNNKKIKKDIAWNDEGIDWFVNDSREEPLKDFTYEEMLRLVYSAKASIIIVDVSSNLNDETVKSFLHHADDIFVCIEPDIVKIDWSSTVMNNGKSTLKQRQQKQIMDYLKEIEKEEGVTYEFLQTKYSKEIDNKTFFQCLEKKPIAFFPAIEYPFLINLVWNSKFLYETEEYHSDVEKALKPIIVRNVPRQFYELPSSKKNNIKKIFKNMLKGD